MSGAEQGRSAVVRTASTCRPHSAVTQHFLGWDEVRCCAHASTRSPFARSHRRGLGPCRPLLYTHRPHWYHRLTGGSKQRAGPICRASSSATSQWYNVTPRAIQGLLADPHKIQAADLSQAAEGSASGRRACRILFLNGLVHVSAQGTLHVIFCVMSYVFVFSRRSRGF